MIAFALAALTFAQAPAESETAGDACPLAPPVPEAAAPPTAAPSGGPPAPRLASAPRLDLDAPTIPLKGMRLERQADGGFLVLDLGNRKLATIRSDGSVTFPSVAGDVSRGTDPHGRRVPGICTGDAATDPQCRRLGAEGRPLGLGDAMGMAALGVVRSARLSSGNPRVRGGLPTPTREEVLGVTREVRGRLARRVARDRGCDVIDRVGRDAGRALLGLQEDPRETRRALFQLWDTIAGQVATAVPDLRAEDAAAIAELAAQTVQLAQDRLAALVRARLPQGAPHAFPAAELRRLNVDRISPLPFDPYGAGTSVSRAPAN